MMVRVRKTGWVIHYDYRSPLEGEAQGCVCACVCVPPSSLERDDGGVMMRSLKKKKPSYTYNGKRQN